MSTQRKKFIALIDKAMADSVQMAQEELMFSYKGILYPATVCSPEVFKALESFEARDDDVFLAGYPKSGKCLLLTMDTCHVQNNFKQCLGRIGKVGREHTIVCNRVCQQAT